MKTFGLSRSTAACAAVGLFVLAQTGAFAQNFAPHPQAVVVTKTDAYLPGPAQMIASANADEVFVNQQGRYVLIVQKEAALPPGAIVGKPSTGAVALLLYDAKLRKTRTLWERRADDNIHYVLQAVWLPGTDCAIAVVGDETARRNTPTDNVADIAKNDSVNTLLFYNFQKSIAPRVLATSTGLLTVAASPTKPLFVVQDDQTLRIGNAPFGALGPVLSVPARTFVGYGWNDVGTSVYGTQLVQVQATPDAKPDFKRKWFLWDGKAGSATLMDDKPKEETMAHYAYSSPTLPVVLRTGTLPVSASLALPTPPAQKPQPKTPAPSPTTILHPLYLEARSDPTTPAANPNHSALLAPDAEESYLLADQSAVLYQSGGALYAVPLVRVNSGVYWEVQKAAAMQNAKQVGIGILMYSQDYDETFPLQSEFAGGIRPYLKNDEAVQSFTYTGPNGGPFTPPASRATTVMGYVAAPGGRAILYVDGHVKWENTP